MRRVKDITFLCVIFAMAACQQVTQPATSLREVDFNFDWKFSELPDTSALINVPLEDSEWRDIRLPHDWSVEHSFDSTLEGCVGYLPGGVGVYQKHFVTPASPTDKSTYILFDGVYNNATFWLNGQKLGINPYGYSPVFFDLTRLLNTDGSDNVLTVHVDRSRFADSRWYAGSGIYRNVKLITLDKVHIPIWGTFVTTPEVSAESATIDIAIKIENQHSEPVITEVKTDIIDNTATVVSTTSETVSLIADNVLTVNQSVVINNPKLWDTENPNMYKAVTYISRDGQIVDQYETPFGIRSIEFVNNEGFYLNGKNTLMKGVCLHHDGGLVGVAVPRGVWKRRLAKLKAAGVNAIRTSHNPFSAEFLDLCDEMGFLVQNEIFDEISYAKDKRLNMNDRQIDYVTRGYAEHFARWAESDLKRAVLRDRNHPSVVQWSIGNEIEWAYKNYWLATGFFPDPEDPKKNTGFFGKAPMHSPEQLKERFEALEKGEYELAKVAKNLNDWIKELDATRPTTANLIIPQISHISGYADAVDIAGYSYRNVIFPWSQKHFPESHTTINECPGTLDDWNQVLLYPEVFSMFMWTGIDYIGERHQDWPEKSAWGDMLDLAGFEVPGYDYFKSIWNNEPHISIGTVKLAGSRFKADEYTGFPVPKNDNSWKWKTAEANLHWNYQADEKILVEVISNYSTVELLLNGRSLGYRSMSMSQDRIMRWIVPYQEGKLTARGVLGNIETIAELKSAGKPTKLQVVVDQESLIADAYDVAHVVVQLVDKDGVPVQIENTRMEFDITGPAKLLGVDNGAWTNTQDFQSNSLVSSKGRALAIIQSTKEEGQIVVTVKADGYDSQTIQLDSK